MLTDPYINVIAGSVTVLFATGLCTFSWYAARKGHWSRALMLLMCCGLLLRIFASLDGHLHDWDEQYHALVSKHMLLHPLKPTLYEHPLLPYDYRNWTQNHIWLHKQPLMLWLIAGSLKIFGLSAFAIRIPSIIFSTLLILLVYDIGARLFAKRIGYISAFLCAIHGFLIDIVSGRAATDHIDAAFLFWITLGVWLAIRHAAKPALLTLLLTGIAMGAGILTKWLPALIILPLWTAAQLHQQRTNWKKLIAELASMCIIAGTIAAPWQFYILRHFTTEAAWEYKYSTAHLRNALEGHTGSAFYHFDNLRIQFGELVYIPVLVFTLAAIRRKGNYAHVLIAIWFWMIYIFFSFAATKMEAYPLIAAPAVWMMIAWHTDTLISKNTNSKYTRWAFNTIAFLLLALPIRYSLERLKPFTTMHRGPHRLFSTGRINTQRLVISNSEFPVEEMFFSDATAYSSTIDSIEVKELILKGYTVVELRQ